MKRLIPLILILCLTGCAGVDIGGLITAALDAIGQSQPTPPPVTPPTEPLPPPQPPPIGPVPVTETIVILDLDKLPEMMRQNGVVGRDGIIYYGVAVAWAQRRGWSSLDNPEIQAIKDQSERIVNVMESLMLNIERRFRVNPGLRGKAIENDARDRLGCDFSPAIKERLREFGDRIDPGNWISEWDY